MRDLVKVCGATGDKVERDFDDEFEPIIGSLIENQPRRKGLTRSLPQV